MAWFKFGKQNDNVPTQQGPTESVDAMRKRALFRLVGSVVLVLAGVVGFPMLFDSQPRSVPVDIPIDIPDKAKAKPLQLPSGTPIATLPVPGVKVDDTASLSGKEEIISNPPTASSVATGNSGDPDRKVADKTRADKVIADKSAKAKFDQANDNQLVPATTVQDKLAKDKAAQVASPSKALLEGKQYDTKPAAAATSTTAPAVTGGERFIVQFGAFTDVAKAREVRQKVEKAGLKTYTQVAKTADGDLIRVRVGPFTSKDEAVKAAAKIKTLDLPASILTL